MKLRILFSGSQVTSLCVCVCVCAQVRAVRVWLAANCLLTLLSQFGIC